VIDIHAGFFAQCITYILYFFSDLDKRLKYKGFNSKNFQKGVDEFIFMRYNASKPNKNTFRRYPHMKKILAIALALVFALPTLALADTLIMGSNCSFPPFEYIDEQGNAAGFDVEIANLIAEKLGLELYVEDMNFDGLLLALDNGEVDLVIAAMTITEKRQEMVNFSTPYFNAQQVVVVQKGYEGIQSYEDIQDKAVSVQDGTTGFLMATEDLGIPADKVVAFKTANDAVAELKLGRVDCMILDSAPAQVFVAQNDDLMILEGIDTPTEEYGIAIKKDNEDLLAAVNELLAEIMENGVYDALIAEFFQ